jgi:hypothetical protein
MENIMNTQVKIQIADGNTPAAKAFPGLTADQAEQVEREAKVEWNKSASERAAFGDNYASFLGYKKAVAAKMVRTQGGRHV